MEKENLEKNSMDNKKKHRVCTVPGCGREHFAKGYCERHYDQLRRYGKILPDKVATKCKVPGCTGKHFCKGYCRKHYGLIYKLEKILLETKMQIACKVAGCSGKYIVKGYCKRHYMQMRKHGKILPEKETHTGCKVPGCKGEHKSKGYCEKHRYQMRRYGKILPDKEKHIGCKVPGCEKKHYGKGYCNRHYTQIRNNGKILPDIVKVPISCKAPGCSGMARARGYCLKHYTQILRHEKIMPDRKIYIGCKVPGCRGEHKGQGYCRKHYSQILKYGYLKPENERRIPNKITVKDKKAEIIVNDKSQKKQFKVVIDAEDVERIKEHHWFSSGKITRTCIKKKNIELSRFILDFPENKLVLHKNKNPFDCRKSNLVAGNRTQLIINAKLSSLNTSGHKGVIWLKREKLWMAYLSYNGRTYRGGYFEEKEKAIEARKHLEEIYHNHLKFFPGEDNDKTE